MSKRPQEWKDIRDVACPSCGAPRGTPCRALTDNEISHIRRGRPLRHGTRRQAAKEWRERTPVDVYIGGPPPRGAAGGFGPASAVLTPKTDAGRRAVLQIPGCLWEHPAAGPGKALVPDARAASDQLRGAGLHVE